jgi:hypothetical protein
MTRSALVLTTTLLVTSPVSALHSMYFSKATGTEYAWQLKGTGGNWLFSFEDTAIVVDGSIPGDPTLVGDFVLLPDMMLSGVTDFGTHLTATLSPTEPLAIRSNPGGSTVMTASLKPAGVLIIGTTLMAYSQLRDDLDVTSFDDTYGTFIPALGAMENAGLPVDISFSGDRKGGGDLRSLILSGSGDAEGTLSGQITVIPAPEALALASLGAAAVCWSRLRRRA